MNTKDFLPDGVTFLKGRAINFSPEANKIEFESGEIITYDFLVVAAGVVFGLWCNKRI